MMDSSRDWKGSHVPRTHALPKSEMSKVQTAMSRGLGPAQPLAQGRSLR